MKIKKGLMLVFLWMVTTTVALSAFELTKVAVVDLGRIKDAYFREAAGLKEVSELKAQYNEYVQKVAEQVSDLKEKQLKAQMNGKKELESQYTQKINAQQRALREYHGIMSEKIRKIQMANQVNNDFEQKLQRVIQQVAIENGYSLVLEDNVDILWFNRADVDITDKVIAALAK